MLRWSTSHGGKGFYFSFDAMMAFTVIAASLAIVSQSSMLTSDSFDSATISYQKANLAGEDAMKLASRQSFRSFNSSFQQELVDNTVMQEEDLDRNVVDGITLLWAARNFSYASRVSERYFDDKIPDRYGYRLQVNNNGNRRVIYETSSTPNDASSVTSISRLVSGHQIDRPSEGFQARARATSITKNETKIIPMPAMGSANENGKLEVRKTFTVPENDGLHYAYLYLNEEYNGDTMFEQMMVNGEQKKNDYTIIRQFKDDVVYARWNLTDALNEGENSIFIRVKGDASQSEPTEFQPGNKIELKYEIDRDEINEDTLRHKKIYFEDLYAETPGSAESGIFKIQGFNVPRRAEFVNASIHFRANGLDSSNCGYSGGWLEPSYNWDVKTIFNGEVLNQTCASGTFDTEYVLNESQVKNGTNVFTAYLENYGNTFWGGNSVELYSDFSTNRSSHIDVWYRYDEEDLKFGKIKVTTAEKFGGDTSNPKVMQKEFEYRDLASSQVYIVERYSNEVELDVNDGSGYDTVFRSPGVRATPTQVSIPPEFYDINDTNSIRLYDRYKQKVGEEGGQDDVAENRDEDLVKFWPDSTFQWTIWVRSQVGYGQLYPNRTAAVEDARKRLKDVLGPHVNATGIDTGALSTGNQPYLWGPASVKLVVWNE